ncbi:MAG: phospholipid carrier-dependent glycosyltransferase [Clostridia bacterium]|nr:phospholipid carrier-dependent glycosyltransferase [Clostridia bacterium]
MEFRKFRNDIRTEDGRRMTKRDYIVLLALLAVYSLVAFLNLGTLSSPHTVWRADRGETAVIDFGTRTEVAEVMFFGSIGEGTIEIYDETSSPEGRFIRDLTDPVAVFKQDDGDMYKWKSASLYTETSFLVLYVKSGSIALNEIAVLNGDDELVPATVYQPTNGAEKLLDEQNDVQINRSYLTDMYFDEIYHARTAYEIAYNDDLYLSEGREAAFEDGYSIYEWTHPSLGKLFIAVGIRIFGMTPFGWRFAGTFFGVLILAVLYVFAKRIFRRTDYALIAASLFAVDGMHFAQTRIATIDTYALFFTLLMFLLMGDYIAEDFEKRPYWKKIALLGLSGLTFGLGVSSKWTCLYSGAGLAVLYFGDLIYNLVRILVKRYKQPKEERKKLPVNVLAYAPVLFTLAVIVLHVAGKWTDWNALKDPLTGALDGEKAGIETIRLFLQPWFYGALLILSGISIASSVVFRLVLSRRKDIDFTLNDLLMTPVWCCLFFIVIPIVLYAATNYCYYISKNCTTVTEKLTELWKTQISMYNYHSKLVATHPCQSMWYRWPLAGKSVWFYSGYPVINGEQWTSNISSTGNPALWFVSAFGAAFGVATWCKDRACRKNRWFIPVLVGILAGLVPWILVTRCVFLYHYFSTIPFMMLMTLLGLYFLEKKYPRTAWFKWAWLIASAVVFLLMLPAVSGIPVPKGYARFIEDVLNVFGKVYYAGI